MTRMNQHQPAVDAFHLAYEQRYGAKPTWTAKRVKQVKDLVRLHGLDEVIRRINVLFSDPPTWMTEPFTVALLVGAFDSLAIGAGVVQRHRDGLSGDELRRMAEQMESDDDAD